MRRKVTGKKFISLAVTAAMALSVTGQLAFAAEHDKGYKSQNYAQNTPPGKSTWNIAVDALIDGDRTTSKGLGNHGADAEWLFYIDMTGVEDLEYNKVKVFYKQYNTSEITVTTGSSVDAKYFSVDGIRKTITVDKDHTETKDMSQVISFDKRTDQYVSVTNKYKNNCNLSEYNGKYPFICEVEVYYVTPDSIAIEAEDSYQTGEGEIPLKANVLDVDGDVIEDSTLNGVKWSVEGSDRVSIDEATGVLTVGSGSESSATVTVKAVSDFDGSVSAEKQIQMSFVSDGSTKSENFAIGKTITTNSNWGGTITNMNDGQADTISDGGNHSAGDWAFCLDLGDSVPEYNKVKLIYAQYNTEYLTLNTGANKGEKNEATDSSYLEIRKDLNYDAKNYGDMTQVFSFAKRNERYIALNNRYLHATNAEDEWKGLSAKIREIEVYYVTPASLEIAADDVYTVKNGDSIEPKAHILDIDGDIMEDPEFDGIKWELSGSDKASIDPATGKITVNGDITVPETVTVTATMTKENYGYVTDEKEITLTGASIASMEISGLPSFIMTNSNQDSSATFKNDVICYDFDGSKINTSLVEWSIKDGPDGVTIDKNSGDLTVNGSAAVSDITIECKATGEGETASAEKTVKINEKVDVVRNAPGFTLKGWGGASVPKAVDGDPETAWSGGEHSAGLASFYLDMGGKQDANYYVLNMSNANNTKLLRLAASESMVDDTGNAFTFPENGKEVDGSFGLYPYNGTNGDSKQRQGTTLLEKETISNHNSGYLDTPMKGMQYIAFLNRMIDKSGDNFNGSVNLGPVLVEDLELYNTAPNYTKIVLPESVDVSTQEQSITMQAELYNGVEKEDKMSGVGKWSSQGFTIDSDTGVLTVPAGTDSVSGTITYNYTSDTISTTTTIYVSKNNGTLKFSDTASQTVELTFSNGVREEDGVLHVPEGMTADELIGSISADAGDIEVVILDSDMGDVDGSSAMSADYTVYVMLFGEVYKEYSVVIDSQEPKEKPELGVTNEGGTYTAAVSKLADYDSAVLVLAEYENGVLQNLKFVEKAADEDTLSVILENVKEGNEVKAMCFDGFGKLNPLTEAQRVSE